MHWVVRAMAAVPLLVPFFCSSACGGATNVDGDAATQGDLQAVCDGMCSRDVRCATADDPARQDCVPDCMEDSGWVVGRARSDVTRALGSCFADLRCGGSDDGCLPQALEDVGIDPEAVIAEADVQQCLRKQDECQETAYSFSDDICTTLFVMVPGARARLAACFEKPCEEVEACSDAVLGQQD